MRSMRSLIAGTVVAMVALGLSTASAEYSWQKPHAKVLPNGDLEWAPELFEFQPEGDVRYIDFEGGNDANPGTREQPWKHHPWDAAAAGRAAGGTADTYVFKGGVTYRGALEVPDGGSGYLTRDPSWGEGEARIYGSEAVTGSWERGAHPAMPGGQTVWHVELDFAPRLVAMVAADDEITRLKLARTPNWEVSDPNNRLSEWWTWDQPEWWLQFQNKNPNLMEVEGKKYHLGVDAEHMDEVGEGAVGGYVWTEYGFPTGNYPYPARVQACDPERKGIAFGGPWFEGPGAMIFAGHRYYLEDRPHYLDEPGEFWFDKKDFGGTLYVRLPGDVDPNTVTIEAAKRIRVINGTEVGDLRVSGLTFRFTNVLWELSEVQFGDPEVHAGVVRVRGAADSVVVDHCRFEHVHLPLRVEAAPGRTVGLVAFNDNVASWADHGVTGISESLRNAEPGDLLEVELLRNKFDHVAFRGSRGRYGSGLRVSCPEICEIAGNIAHRCGIQGIDVYGGKLNGQSHEAPLSRTLIHHNKVVDSLLMASDWGGIETWQGGPFYVFNNISGNPGGLMNWQHKPEEKSGTPRFAFSFYTDGASKNYHFNNIAWGRNNEPGSIYANNSAFQSLIGFANMKFNNTIYRFVNGTRRQGTGGSRMQKYLGNVFQDISEYVFLHHQGKGDPNISHFNNVDNYDFRAMAYAANYMEDPGLGIGVISERGIVHETIRSMARALREFNAAAAAVGEVVPPPLRDPEGGDFRLAEGSPAVDAGVRVFVPWSLYGAVGEWNFVRNNADPAVVIDEHWYMTEACVDRSTYQTCPRYHLRGTGISADDYVTGALEDWTPGALRLDGEEQFLSISHETLVEPYTIQTAPKSKNMADKVRTLSGDEKRTVDMQDNSFTVEAYLRTEDADGLIAGKSDDTGYALRVSGGMPQMELSVAGGSLTVTGTSRLADGRWHHVLAEVDRRAGKIALYVDGKAASLETDGAIPRGSLSNEADFVVGKGLACTLDFLRVSRGTLADARTSIEELYAWQFDGPQFRDFAGHKPAGKRDAGAIEQVD
ncbi:MAG: laminin G domain-containing protein [Candidatus Brocadiia bacterium]